MLRRPGGFADGPNARSKSVTVAEGDETFGVSDAFASLRAKVKLMTGAQLSSGSLVAAGTEEGCFRAS